MTTKHHTSSHPLFHSRMGERTTRVKVRKLIGQDKNILNKQKTHVQVKQNKGVSLCFPWAGKYSDLFRKVGLYHSKEWLVRTETITPMFLPTSSFFFQLYMLSMTSHDIKYLFSYWELTISSESPLWPSCPSSSRTRLLQPHEPSVSATPQQFLLFISESWCVDYHRCVISIAGLDSINSMPCDIYVYFFRFVFKCCPQSQGSANVTGTKYREGRVILKHPYNK